MKEIKYLHLNDIGVFEGVTPTDDRNTEYYIESRKSLGLIDDRNYNTFLYGVSHLNPQLPSTTDSPFFTYQNTSIGSVNKTVCVPRQSKTSCIDVIPVYDNFYRSLFTDVVDGDWIVSNEFGASLGIGRLMTWIQSNDNSFVELYKLDRHVRFFGLEYFTGSSITGSHVARYNNKFYSMAVNYYPLTNSTYRRDVFDPFIAGFMEYSLGSYSIPSGEFYNRISSYLSSGYALISGRFLLGSYEVSPLKYSYDLFNDLLTYPDIANLSEFDYNHVKVNKSVTLKGKYPVEFNKDYLEFTDSKFEQESFKLASIRYIDDKNLNFGPLTLHGDSRYVGPILYTINSLNVPGEIVHNTTSTTISCISPPDKYFITAFGGNVGSYVPTSSYRFSSFDIQAVDWTGPDGLLRHNVLVGTATHI